MTSAKTLELQNFTLQSSVLNGITFDFFHNLLLF